MKKMIAFLLVTMLLFGVVFATPAQAYVDILVLSGYVSKQSGAKWISSKYHPGSMEYWHVRTVEEKSWVGANRPEKLMGDANIDGKVDARDALVALYFGLYGNPLTSQASSPPKTPYRLGWESYFSYMYRTGKQEEYINRDVFCWYYCHYNSAFFADVTKDCVVNSLDALQILKYSVGKAKNFPEGDFTTISRDFGYYPWPTEYYPGFFDSDEYDVYMTVEEFREKYHYYPNATPTDQ